MPNQLAIVLGGYGPLPGRAPHVFTQLARKIIQFEFESWSRRFKNKVKNLPGLTQKYLEALERECLLPGECAVTNVSQTLPPTTLR